MAEISGALFRRAQQTDCVLARDLDHDVPGAQQYGDEEQCAQLRQHKCYPGAQHHATGANGHGTGHAHAIDPAAQIDRQQHRKQREQSHQHADQGRAGLQVKGIERHQYPTATEGDVGKCQNGKKREKLQKGNRLTTG